MVFTIQENEFEIKELGAVTKEGNDARQKVFFLYNGQTIERDILISADEASSDISTEQFYYNNQEAITTDLIKYLSDNHHYMNK